MNAYQCSVSHPGPNFKAALVKHGDFPNWDTHAAFGSVHAMAKESVRLPPGDQRLAIQYKLLFQRPFTKDFSIEARCGCEGAIPYDFKILSTKELVEKMFVARISRDASAEELENEVFGHGTQHVKG